ncbi:LysR family transcriptional regulator [Marinobacter sp. M3C]|uniref:LysR family transcriptional regulator n=1 Tax=Marinobacter sp. M3C TaxID=2917715 RepID=UPI00200F9465|nr:LysR family transcriptional regulator [Marinobacter sp. M3C]UQG61219.1 LysR family transcriptional regulator [Marinobacter sp. M3C]
MLAAIGEKLSFTKAAERLGVDQSAVSHRIRSLEDALGHTLFDRTTRRLRLTEIGEILCHAAIDSMASWDTALDKLEHSRSTDLIRLSLSSSLAMKWLIPALPNAHALNLKLSLDVQEETVDFLINDADAAIRFGPGPYPGLHSSYLTHCWMQPVASPGYLGDGVSDAGLLEKPETVFLGDRRGEIDETDFSWDYYFSTIGSRRDGFNPDYQFDRADLMLQAVIGGMGVGLGRTLLLEGDVEAGYLKMVGPSIRMRSGYWLVCASSFAETDRFRKLLDWIKSEIKKIT